MFCNTFATAEDAQSGVQFYFSQQLLLTERLQDIFISEGVMLNNILHKSIQNWRHSNCAIKLNLYGHWCELLSHHNLYKDIDVCRVGSRCLSCHSCRSHTPNQSLQVHYLHPAKDNWSLPKIFWKQYIFTWIRWSQYITRRAISWYRLVFRAYIRPPKHREWVQCRLVLLPSLLLPWINWS